MAPIRHTYRIAFNDVFAKVPRLHAGVPDREIVLGAVRTTSPSSGVRRLPADQKQSVIGTIRLRHSRTPVPADMICRQEAFSRMASQNRGYLRPTTRNVTKEAIIINAFDNIIESDGMWVVHSPNTVRLPSMDQM